jgi:hypothetical protein
MRLNSEFLPKMAKPIRLLSIRHPPFDFADPNRGSCPFPAIARPRSPLKALSLQRFLSLGSPSIARNVSQKRAFGMPSTALDP